MKYTGLQKWWKAQILVLLGTTYVQTQSLRYPSKQTASNLDNNAKVNSFLYEIVIKQPQRRDLWGNGSDKSSVSNWLTSWQTRDTRDVLFAVIQHSIDSGEDTALCEIKRPLKRHFAFGNNNKISVTVQAPVSVWPSFVWGHFVTIIIEKEHTHTHT